MRKITIGFIMLLCLVLTMSVAGAEPNTEAASMQKQVVIVPFINSTEETKDYIDETVQAKFTEQFSNTMYQTIPAEKVQPLLTAYQLMPQIRNYLIMN